MEGFQNIILTYNLNAWNDGKNKYQNYEKGLISARSKGFSIPGNLENICV